MLYRRPGRASELSADILRYTAWWIAFGPHGPRAEDPPGEWTKILWYTTIGVAVSAALFFGIHAFARPPPRTMTKEWQEATNEYLKVRCLCMLPSTYCQGIYKQGADHADLSNRKRESTPSTVSAAKDTREKATCRASLQRHRASIWIRRNRKRTLLLSWPAFLYFCTTRLASRQGVPWNFKTPCTKLYILQRAFCTDAGSRSSVQQDKPRMAV